MTSLWSSMQAPQNGMSKSRRIVLAACICLSFWLFWHIASIDIALPTYGGISKAVQHSCKHLAEDQGTLFILRTGVTEIVERLPTHISTSLQCSTQHVIFSDYAENFLGERVLDALEFVDPDIVANNSDFELYRRVKQHGRAVLSQGELSGNRSQTPSGTGHTEIPGWKLDKWKFVPMVNRTFYEYPDMKWYVFAEGDTSILWSTLQAYLASMDHTQPHYLGSSTNIGDDPAFAYGGAGFIVSQPAMRMVADYYSTHKAQIEITTENAWAGDAVLGRIFFDAGVPVKDIWPVVHGASTSQALFARPFSPGVPKEAEQVWCYPAASLHHMSPAAVNSLWHYEQKWLEQRVNVQELIRHKDIFKDLVIPQMTDLRTDWDNLNDHDEGDATSLDECRAVCERNSTCRQYSYDQDGKCTTRVNPRLGVSTKGVTSGWLEDRVAAFADEMPPCAQEGFDNLPGPW